MLTNTLDKIGEALNGRRNSDGSWMCCCPVHDDKTPSLKVRAGDTAILVHCFASCDRGDVIAALRELGLLPRGGRRVRNRHQNKKKLKTKTEYQYAYGVITDDVMDELSTTWDEIKKERADAAADTAWLHIKGQHFVEYDLIDGMIDDWITREAA